MNRPIELVTKFKDRIISKYPALEGIHIPENYQISLVNYRSTDIEKYDVIFWHRLMRRYYQEPLEIECEIRDLNHDMNPVIQNAIFRRTQERNNWQVIGIEEALASKIQSGELKPFPINWKYFIGLPSGGILEIGTKDRNTIFYIAQVINSEASGLNDSNETEKFITLILEEANRLKSQLFNPVNEFKKSEDLKMYRVFNVYLSNYLSAEAMLRQAESQEVDLRHESLRYDMKTSDFYDEEKRKYIDRFILVCGMFYCSVITYFFMALEGFLNLVFHAFLKKDLRNKDLNIDQRLDLEQKLQLMSSLCNGFKENRNLSPTILQEFKMLKRYRNILFHSKVEDSLKSLCFFEDGFLYDYDMEAYKDSFLPTQKIKLTGQDVIEVKRVVDNIVDSILNSMNQQTRMLTEKYILNEPQIPFLVLETGDIMIGGKDQQDN